MSYYLGVLYAGLPAYPFTLNGVYFYFYDISLMPKSDE
jgi:hypothetical protein